MCIIFRCLKDNFVSPFRDLNIKEYITKITSIPQQGLKWDWKRSVDKLDENIISDQ